MSILCLVNEKKKTQWDHKMALSVYDFRWSRIKTKWLSSKLNGEIAIATSLKCTVFFTDLDKPIDLLAVMKWLAVSWDNDVQSW